MKVQIFVNGHTQYKIAIEAYERFNSILRTFHHSRITHVKIVHIMMIQGCRNGLRPRSQMFNIVTSWVFITERLINRNKGGIQFQ